MCANDMQNRAQMKESKCAKDILKCANEKRRYNYNLENSNVPEVIKH